MPNLEFSSLCQQLSLSSPALQTVDAWPAEQLQALADTEVLGWLIPEEFGGGDVSPLELVRGYMQLASACLPTTFILTQRNAAIQRLVRCENPPLKSDLLPDLVSNELFVTVGISHLTTSRQHLKKPAVAVTQVDTGFIFDGSVPWVTGADKANCIVTGGTLEDGRQVLAVMDTACEGVSIEDPVPLMALNATRTASVNLRQVYVPDTDVVFGPAENVMQLGGVGAGSYTTSALAIGHAAGALTALKVEAERRPDLTSICDSFQSSIDATKADLENAVQLEAAETPDELGVENMRRRCNSLALRTTQAYLAASKGAGFVSAHRASQLVQEAMFFLVWSCPQQVALANMRELAAEI